MLAPEGLFFDYNASHPMLPSVRRALCEKLQNYPNFFSNPMSVHGRGRHAKRLVYELKESFCQWFGIKSDEEIIINSGASEGLNTVIHGFVNDRRAKGRVPVLVHSAIEHSAVTTTCENLTEVERVVIPVNRFGELDSDVLLNEVDRLLLNPDVDLLLIFQIANNETGSVFNFSFLAELHLRFGQKPQLHLPKKKGGKFPLTEQRIWTLLDGAQAIGKLEESEIRKPLHYADYFAVSSHKIGGPAGIGILWVRPGAPYCSLISGGPQEKRRRAGTHNILGIYGFTVAIQDWIKNGDRYRTHLKELQQTLLEKLKKVDGIHFNALFEEKLSLPNTLNFWVKNCPDEALLMGLDLKGVYVSSGAACNSGSVKPSIVLLNMGFSEDIARSSIRISLGIDNTFEDIEKFMKIFNDTVVQIHRAQIIADEFLPRLNDSSMVMSAESVG